MSAFIEMTGRRFGRLVVVKKAHSDDGVYWEVVCDCGNTRVVKGTSLRNGSSTSCGCKQAEHIKAVGHRNKGRFKTFVTYNGMHYRIRDTRGRAADHQCACGAPAHDWAYDHSDPNEQTEIVTVGGWTGEVAYSLDLDRYVPMCKPCHKSFDIERKVVAA